VKLLGNVCKHDHDQAGQAEKLQETRYYNHLWAYSDLDNVGEMETMPRTIKRDAHALYLAARDPRVPWYAKALAMAVAGYALSPN
jgi:uncharacterized membrane protein YkvA (DUF1232 family)